MPEPVTRGEGRLSQEVVSVDFDSAVSEDKQKQVDRLGDLLAIVGVALVEKVVIHEGADIFVVHRQLYDSRTFALALSITSRAGC